MGTFMSKLFPSGPVLELDHVQCCNNTTEETNSSSSDDGVVYSGKLNAVIRKVVDTWPLNGNVEMHVRQVRLKNIEQL